MFGIGFQEMLIILVVVLIFFGPKRLPDLAKSLGKGIAEFKKASDEIRKGIDEAVKEGEAAADAKDAPPQDAQGQAAAEGAPAPETPVPQEPPPGAGAAPPASADAKEAAAKGQPPTPPSAPAG